MRLEVGSQQSTPPKREDTGPRRDVSTIQHQGHEFYLACQKSAVITPGAVI